MSGFTTEKLLTGKHLKAIFGSFKNNNVKCLTTDEIMLIFKMLYTYKHGLTDKQLFDGIIQNLDDIYEHRYINNTKVYLVKINDKMSNIIYTLLNKMLDIIIDIANRYEINENIKDKLTFYLGSNERDIRDFVKIGLISKKRIRVRNIRSMQTKQVTVYDCKQLEDFIEKFQKKTKKT